MTSDTVTLIPLLLILAAGTIVSGLRARAAETRSKRLGMATVACGVAGFIPALLGPTFKEPDQIQTLVACGLITILAAVAAIVLALWAFRARRRDRGCAGYYPVAGLLCGAANLFCGSGLVVTGSAVQALTEDTAWTWRSERHGFEVTVPSKKWSAKPNPNVLAEFTGSRPTIVAIVGGLLPAESDDEFNEALAYGRRVKSDTPTSNTDERSGPNRHGHPHWMYTGDAKSGDKSYFFGISITRVSGKAVLLMFEGPYRFSSEVGRAQEIRALHAQADRFLGSVK